MTWRNRLILFALGVIGILFWAIASSAQNIVDSETCSYNGIPLYGDVQVVESFPDILVQTVTSFPDLKVQVVTSFPDSCGKWQFVESFPDFKVQFVESFPDIKIQFVTAFPGLP